jgi:plastocyanin
MVFLNHLSTVTVIATSSISITTDEDDNEDDNNPSDLQKHEQPIQPTSGAQEKENDDDNDDGYYVVIPDGAAWKESVSERFDPLEIYVPIGSDVTWTNEDDSIHAIVSGKESGYGMYEYTQDGIINSGNLNEGESFSFHFTEPGRYEYYCVPHPWMNGVVIVE